MTKKDLTPVEQRAAMLALQYAGSQITGLNGSQVAIVRAMTAKAQLNGWAEQTLVRHLADVIALSPRDAKAVENYRQSLAAGVKDKNGKMFKQPVATQRKMVARYTQRLTSRRLKVVAAQEMQQQQMDAQRQLWQEEQANGDISSVAVRITRVHRDERLCKVCRPQNGRRRSLIDPVGPPFHVGCRCREELVDEGKQPTWSTPAPLY